MRSIALIYNLLALHLMVQQADLIYGKLGLGSSKISGAERITFLEVQPPRNSDWVSFNLPNQVMRNYQGFSAAIRTTNLAFTANQLGLIFTQTHPLGENGISEDWKDSDQRIGVPVASVNDQTAHDLARSWMRALGLDVAAMEKNFDCRVEHQRLPLTNDRTVSSEFKVTWAPRGWNPRNGAIPPACAVSLNETEKWLASFRISDLALCRNLLPRVPHDIAVNLLSDEPVRNYFHLGPGSGLREILKQEGDAYTNVLKLLESPAGYQEEGRRILLAEAKKVFSILDWDRESALKDENLVDAYLNPPAFAPGGCLEYKHAEVQFDARGQLKCAGFDFPEMPDAMSWATNYDSWVANTPSLITTNEAFQLAMRKLAALSIDTDLLTRMHKRRETWRDLVHTKTGQRRAVDSPFYGVEWKDDRLRPAVAAVMVDRKLSKVVRVLVNDTSYCHRTALPIPKSEK